MRIFSGLCTLLLASSAYARGKWGFEDAQVTVQARGAGVGGGATEKLIFGTPLKEAVSLGPTDTLKLQLTTTEDKSTKRPHQAFLTLQEQSSGLEESFAVNIKESGKGKLELTQKDLPIQHLTTSEPLRASLVIADFGYSTPLNSHTFDLTVMRDQNVPVQIPPAPLRYGKLDEIHHIFRADPKSPYFFISAVFTSMVFMTLTVLCGTWMTIGANLNHFMEAVNTAPIAYASFVGSILTLEFLFFLYYLGWTLFKTMPAVLAVGSITFLSGSRALSEVQSRRLAGKR
ncbi:MAG: hypothetical protein M1828_000420 [Chrysothrix sp. TS-e1954]|nr:MAG: hypothetical protein M1828_000420 [Chrysothrix sp. TS-e1954]